MVVVLNGTLKQRDTLETIFFSILLIHQKIILFDHIIDIRNEPAGLGPAGTLFDG